MTCVFPASAGMIPEPAITVRRHGGVPRIRGDDPATITGFGDRTLFPASAGMIRTCRWGISLWRCVPRIRGDDPRLKVLIGATSPCSPHPRG